MATFQYPYRVGDIADHLWQEILAASSASHQAAVAMLSDGQVPLDENFDDPSVDLEQVLGPRLNQMLAYLEDRDRALEDFLNHLTFTAAPLLSSQHAAAWTFVAADAGTIVEYTGAGAASFTIPPVSAVPWPTNTIIEAFQDGAGQLTIAAGAGVTLRSDGTKVKTAGQYATIGMRHRATNEWVLSGDLA